MMYPVLLLLLFAAYGVVCWRNLRTGLLVFAVLLPAYLLRFSVGSLPTTALEVMLLIAVGVWVVQGAPLQSIRTLGKWRAPLLLVLAAGSFAASYAPDLVSALGLWKAYIVEPALAFLLFRSVMTTREDWRSVMTAFMWSGVVISCVALAQYVTDMGIPAPWDVERRVTSVFDFPNAVGLYVAPILSITLLHYVYDRSLRVAGALLMAAAIVLAKTEAALVAVPAALLITLLFSKATTHRKAVVVAATVTIAASLFAFVPRIQEKLLLNDHSGLARKAMWQETLALLADHPLLGAGLGGYPSAVAPYHDATLYEIFQYPHNIVLNIGVELGLFGLLSAGVATYVAARALYDRRDDPLALGVVAALATMAVHGLVDVPFFKNDLALMTAILLACAASLPLAAKAGDATPAYVVVPPRGLSRTQRPEPSRSEC